MMALIKGIGWKLMAAGLAVIAFLAMWLRLKYVSDAMDRYRREARTRAERARVSGRAAKAEREVREEAKRHEREEAERHDAGRRPTGNFGDRVRRRD